MKEKDFTIGKHIEQNIETELSPEQIEKIMEKVQDIYEYGTAYVSLPEKSTAGIGGTSTETIEKVLQDGLLGTPKTEEYFKLDDETEQRIKRELRKEWLASVKQTKSAEVHFNIVGRALAIGHKGPTNEIKEFKRSEPGKEGKPFPRLNALSDYYGYPMIVFDISKFQEVEPVIGEDEHKVASKSPQQTNTYRIRTYEEGSVDLTPDERGNIGIAPEYGFRLSFRVAPRNFSGFVVNSESQKEQLLALMKKIYKNSPEKMLPIYIQAGLPLGQDSYYPDSETEQYNRYIKEAGRFELLWPEKMSNDEVKQFVKNRGVKKKN